MSDSRELTQPAEMSIPALHQGHDDLSEASGKSLSRDQPITAQQEFIDLGVGSNFSFSDDRGQVAARPKPYGLILVPAEVEAIVAPEESRLSNEHGIIPTPEARQRMVDSLSLQYYFDGIDVAYRRSPRGVEVVAIGLEEVGQFIENATPDQREAIVIGQG